MTLVEKLDDHGKPAWIGVMVLSFIVFWPAGLAILGYLIWSGRMACGRKRGPGRWHNERSERNGGRGFRRRWGQQARTSGNAAFDEYREETLKRLEEEQTEFLDFLERLRHAKDKAEFDQFMSDRKAPTVDGEATNGGTPQPQT